MGSILKFSIINSKNISWESDQLLVFLVENNRPSQYFKKWQSLTGNNINNIIENASFSFKFGQDLLVRSSKNSILLFGYGATRKTNLDYEKLGGILFSKIDKLGFREITIISNLEVSENKQNVIISKLLLGFKLKSYSFLKYKENNKINSKKIENVKVLKKEKKILEQQLHLNDNLISGIFFSKDLTFEPPNFLTPQEFVNQITSLKKIGIEIEVLNEKNMDKLGMHALLGVGRGSIEKSYLVVMKWNGSPNSKKNIAYVGKGVCFDSGGLSLKTPRGMIDMKEDMGGAGIVVGAMKAIALQKVKRNVIGVVGLVENMPSSNAQRPGDIVKSMSGKTIEILNTDAEGRLVLADALYFTIKKFKPDFVIDLATLTGAIISALGKERAGLFSNDENLSEYIFQTGEKIENLVWKMPMDKIYGQKMLSKIADLKNIGTPEGSSIQAAAFLQNFVGRTSWAHLDVAGVVWSDRVSDIHSGGATGWGVRLLFEIAKNNYRF